MWLLTLHFIYLFLFTIELKAPVVHDFQYSSTTLNESQPWTASCTVQGFHLPNVTWLKSGKELPVCIEESGQKCSTDELYVVIATKVNAWTVTSKLSVRSIQHSMGIDDNYTCMAVNSLGSSKKSVRLIIQGEMFNTCTCFRKNTVLAGLVLLMCMW